MPLMSETPLGERVAPAPYPPGWWVPDPVGAGARRPGTVLAAALVTWVSSAITLLGTASLLVFLLWLGEPILDSFDGSRPVVVWSAAGVVAWSVLACLLAHWALAGRNWARIGLAVSAAATVVASASAFWLGVPLLSLFAAIAVLVLLFIGGANEWYRSRNQKETP
jgi:hypothetical protein